MMRVTTLFGADPFSIRQMSVLADSMGFALRWKTDRWHVEVEPHDPDPIVFRRFVELQDFLLDLQQELEA